MAKVMLTSVVFCVSAVKVLWIVYESQLVNSFPEQQPLSHNQGMFALTAPGVQ